MEPQESRLPPGMRIARTLDGDDILVSTSRKMGPVSRIPYVMQSYLPVFLESELAEMRKIPEQSRNAIISMKKIFRFCIVRETLPMNKCRVQHEKPYILQGINGTQESLF